MAHFYHEWKCKIAKKLTQQNSSMPYVTTDMLALPLRVQGKAGCSSHVSTLQLVPIHLLHENPPGMGPRLFSKKQCGFFEKHVSNTNLE